MTTPTLSVIVPCHNEESNLPALAVRCLRVFGERGLQGELLLVDDGSTDGTAAIIRELEAAHPDQVRGVFHDTNRGITAAWESGLAAADGQYTAIMDADLQYLPEDLWRLYRELLHTNADVVQGCRSQIGRPKHLRYYLSVGLNRILNFLFGMHLRDNKSGFLMCERDVLAHVLQHRFSYAYFQTFITVSAHAKGYTVRDIETLFEDRKQGESFISAVPWKVVLRSLGDLVKGFVEFRLLDLGDDTLREFLRAHPPAREPDALPLWRRLHFRLFGLLMPVHHWMISYPALRYYEQLRRTQWWTPDQLAAYQARKLQQLVRHAYRHVPFYRERFEALGLTPEDITSPADLAKLPTLSKDDVRANLYFDLLADNHDKNRIQKITTSGSTGEPFVTYADKFQLEMRWATTLRNQGWTGYRFGDRAVRLWHTTIGMTRLQALRERLDAWLQRRRFLSAYDMTQGNLEGYFAAIERARPALLDGYAESFNMLAEYLKDHPRPDLRPKGIISSAQTLSAQSRQIIEEAFHCRVFDKYGSREFSGIAHECDAHDGLHVNGESYIVEVLRDGQPATPGELGEVCITDLNNFCVPLIRYRLGDLAVLAEGACACGRGLPRLARVEGRVQAIILGTNGAFVPGTYFAHLLKDYDYAIRQFQVVQEREGHLHVKLIKGERYADRTLEEILGALRERLGADMDLDVEFVDHIPLGRTGKHYHSISRLNLNLQTNLPAAAREAS